MRILIEVKLEGRFDGGLKHGSTNQHYGCDIRASTLSSLKRGLKVGHYGYGIRTSTFRPRSRKQNSGKKLEYRYFRKTHLYKNIVIYSLCSRKKNRIFCVNAP